MKLTDFAVELDRVNNLFQVLAGIKTMMPNYKDPHIDAAQLNAENTFKKLMQTWERAWIESARLPHESKLALALKN